MADKPNQFQMSYDAEQDRILLRINTEDRSEFRLWLTRRMVRAIWKGLAQVMEAETESAPAPEADKRDADKREAILRFDHQAAVEQADFETPFENSASSYPLGEAGILVTSIALGINAAGLYVMKLDPREGKGISMNLNQRLLHFFMQMMIDCSANSGWDLHLRWPLSGTSGRARTSPPDKALRH